ncbi:hypothetical protein, partial [Pseudooctadecabacter sp.]|uniref:hypothetical protein n=1 Tax=Pseudooctadecabacter sp. TaxID=1966338 RepID=UPI0025D893B0
MQTSTLALLGGGVVAVALGAAVYMRPLPEARAPVAGTDAVAVEEAAGAAGGAPEETADVDAGLTQDTAA